MPVFNVLDYGASGNGVANDALPIQKAIDACSEAGGGQVLFPSGRTYKAGWIELKSNIELTIERGAILLASEHYADFDNPHIHAINSQPQNPNWIHMTERNLPMAFISAHDAENIRISGGGTIDGNGRSYVQVEDPHIHRMKPQRPWTVFCIGVKNLDLQDIAIRDGALWTLRLSGCSEVTIHAIRVYNDMKLPNCDAIDLDRCQNVRISDCFLAAGDDTIALKATGSFAKYGTTENITVTGCTLVSTSSALVIGSEVRDTIRNVVFDSCIIRSSHRGLSLNLSMEGNIENITFSNIVIETRLFHDDWWGRGEPIYIKTGPWTEFDVPGHIHNVRFSNIRAQSENGILVHGWADGLIDGILFENVQVEVSKWTKWPGGWLDIRPIIGENNGYAQGVMQYPTSGFMLHHASNITLRNCQVLWNGIIPDYFEHAVEAIAIDHLHLENFQGDSAFPGHVPAILES